MKKWLKRSIGCVLAVSVFATLLTGWPAQAAQEDPFLAMIHEQLDEPEMENSIEARWWLAEGTHTDQTLKEGVQSLFEAGYGAIEFVTLNETGVDHKRYAWGSEEWKHDSELIINEATKYGMGVSFTSGTNWGTANLPTITPDDEEAAQQISYASERLAAGESRTGELPLATITTDNVHKQTLINVMAYRVDTDAQPLPEEELDLSHIPEDAVEWIMTSRMLTPSEIDVTYLDYDTCIPLTDLAQQDENGQWRLDWTAPQDGEYELMVFWMHGTGHYSEPSIGTNYSIDYISGKGADALIDYWNENLLTDELIKTIQENGRVQLYMDSLELTTYGEGGHYWSSDFLSEFQQRRGYDLTPYLPFIMRVSERSINYYYQTDVQEQQDILEKVRTDLYQTLTEMYSENTLGKIQSWLHSIGMTLRCENSYCQTFEITYPMQYIDSVETESFEFMDQLESFRAMSGGAHAYNKVLSSESGAQYARYSTSFDRLLNMMYTQFAAGVSRTVTHGFSVAAGPESNFEWPGHQYNYALFSERAPYWRDSVDVNSHIARLQKILREGESRMDVAILRYDYELFSFQDNAFYDALSRHYGYYWTDLTLQDAGYTYDYFSLQVLEDDAYGFLNEDDTLGYAGYQAVILYQEALAYDSAQALLRLAQQGLPVVIVDGESVEYQWGQNFNFHEGAAKRTPFNDGLDDELAVVMNQMKQLDNVKVVPSQADAYDALQEMGVRPRAEFAELNQKLLTVTREWEDARFLYVYNYKFDEPDAYSGDIVIDGAYIPYEYDTWTGNVTQLGTYRIDEAGNTVVSVNLEPGEIAVFALNPNGEQKEYAVSTDANSIYREDGTLRLSASESGTYTTTLSNGRIVSTEVVAPQNVPLSTWDLTVESWLPGDVTTRSEDRGLGYTTTEYEQLTKKENIDVGQTELKSWTDMEAVGGSVSGVGYYKTEFTLPDSWDQNNRAIFTVDSLGGATAQVYVNGIKADPVDITNVELDITDYVRPGHNQIEVQIATGLTNVLISLGKNTKSYGNIWTGPYDYGMIGQAQIITTSEVLLESSAADKSILTKVLAYAEQQYADPAFDNIIANVQATFAQALENARAVNRDSSASQEAVDSAWKSLMTEIHKLGFVRGDKTALGKLIELSDRFCDQIEQYTPGTANPFTAVLAEAKAVYEDGNAMQDDVAKAESELLEAMMNLRYKADKSVLESVLATASGIDSASYTEQSAAVFEAAYSEAKTVHDNEDATQAEVNDTVDHLNEAIRGLVAINTKTDDSGDQAPTVEGEIVMTTGGRNAKTGDTASAAIALSVLLLAATGLVMNKKRG